MINKYYIKTINFNFKLHQSIISRTTIKVKINLNQVWLFQNVKTNIK